MSSIMHAKDFLCDVQKYKHDAEIIARTAIIDAIADEMENHISCGGNTTDPVYLKNQEFKNYVCNLIVLVDPYAVGRKRLAEL